ncbi:MAG TPA: sulfatase [Kofleriaceae bacterium]
MLRPRDRFGLALLVMTLAAALSECVRAWPAESPGGPFALLLVAQVVVLSAMWTAPVAGIMVAAAAARHRWWPPQTTSTGDRKPETGDGKPGPGPVEVPRWTLWLGPVGFAMVTAGTGLLRWSQRAFVRQDLAAAVMPVALIAVFAAVAALAVVAHRALGDRIARLPRWAVLAIAIGGVAIAGIVHLARFPAVLDDPLIPALIQVAVVVGLGALVFVQVRSLPRRPGWIGIGAFAGIWLALFLVLLQGGRIAPLSYPVAAAALEQRGMAAARVAPLLGRLGDGDGDGFGRWFGGLDCDDDDPSVNPLAPDRPDDGVDQDCFDGDLAAAAVAADRAERARGRRPPARRVDSVLLVTVDALRADAVGFGGATKPSSPNLDRLARRSAVFTAAWSPAPMTRRAFPALLSGRYPSNVHWLDLETGYPYPVSHEDNLYLAEVLQSAGLKTAMAVPFNYAVNSRFDQGFEEKQVRPASRYKDEICGNLVVDDASKILAGWAAAGPSPRFFLWVHFYEAHFPYARHPEYRFGDEPHDRYLAEVRYIDEQVGRLLARLDELGLADTTAVVFTGDHGEEFGEHGGEAHGDLYPEDLRVPLLVHLPGAAARRITGEVRLIDVAPTITDLLGVAPPPSFDGESLVPQLDGAPVPDRPMFAELIPDKKVPRRVVSIAAGGWQLIVDFALGSRELFDLKEDPTAQKNRLVEAPDRARELEGLLRRHMELRVGPLVVDSAKKKRAGR